MRYVQKSVRGRLLQSRSLAFLVVVCLISLCLAGCSHGRAIERGDILLEQGNYSQALLAYEEALQVKPESERAAAGIAESRRRIVLEFVAKGQGALNEQEVVTALGYWEQASDVPGYYSELRRFGDELRVFATALAEVAEEGRDYAVAMFVYDRFAQSGLVDGREFERRTARIATVWAEELEHRGREKVEDGYDAYGLLLFAQASNLSSNALYRGLRDQVWQRVRPSLIYRVRVNREGSRGLYDWSGPAFVADGDSVLQVLTDVSGIDVDATVQVKNMSPAIVHRESTRVESVEYQSGTREVSNPDYEYAEERLYRAERRLTEVEREVTKRQTEVSRRQIELERIRTRESGESNSRTRRALGELEDAHNDLERSYRDVNDARSKVQRIRDRLNRTQKTVVEPVYAIYRYPIITHTADGRIEVNFTIHHADGRAALHESVVLQVEFRDYAHDSHPAIELGRKYVEIPSDHLIEERLMRLATDHIMEGIRSSLDGYRAAVLNHASVGQNPDEKADGLVRYLLLSAGRQHVEVDDVIYEMTGIPAAHQVLLDLNN